MSEIFISYSRQDRARAKQLAHALEDEGFRIWWDRKIPPGRSFDEVIEEALDRAQCVIVLWSRVSTESDWVKEEAAYGKQRGVLVPVLIDATDLPLGFGRIQTANLVDWQGEKNHPEWLNLVASITTRVRRPQDTASPDPDSTRVRRRDSAIRRSRLWPWATVLVTVLALAGGFLASRWGLLERRIEPTVVDPPTISKEENNPGDPEKRPVPTPAHDHDPPAPTPEENAEASAAAEAKAKAEEEAKARANKMATARLTEIDQLALTAVDDQELIDAYRLLLEKHGRHLDPATANRVRKTAGALQQVLKDFDQLAAASSELPLDQLEQAWTAFEPPRPHSPLASERQRQLLKIERIRNEQATVVTAEKNFITGSSFRSGADDKVTGLTGISQSFAAGTAVHLFARVHAPRAEMLRLEWRFEGKILHSRQQRVQASAGYRIFFSKTYGQAGQGEVRLYNQEQVLIASRELIIEGASRAPSRRFTLRDRETFADTQRSHLWTRHDRAAGKALRWKAAAKVCSQLRLSGKTDWRLPSIGELAELYKYGGEIKLALAAEKISLWSAEQQQLDFTSGQYPSSPDRNRRTAGVLCVHD